MWISIFAKIVGGTVGGKLKLVSITGSVKLLGGFKTLHLMEFSLCDVNWDKYRRVLIYGPHYCGKSTLCNTIMYLISRIHPTLMYAPIHRPHTHENYQDDIDKLPTTKGHILCVEVNRIAIDINSILTADSTKFPYIIVQADWMALGDASHFDITFEYDALARHYSFGTRYDGTYKLCCGEVPGTYTDIYGANKLSYSTIAWLLNKIEGNYSRWHTIGKRLYMSLRETQRIFHNIFLYLWWSSNPKGDGDGVLMPRDVHCVVLQYVILFLRGNC